MRQNERKTSTCAAQAGWFALDRRGSYNGQQQFLSQQPTPLMEQGNQGDINITRTQEGRNPLNVPNGIMEAVRL